MTDEIKPINPAPVQPANSLAPPSAQSIEQTPESGKSFKEILAEFFAQNTQALKDYENAVENVVTNKSGNIADVSAAAQKAQIVNNLIIQIGNKLAELHTKLNQEEKR